MKDTDADTEQLALCIAPLRDRADARSSNGLWHEHSLVDLILTACDESDDQAEIGALVDDLLEETHPMNSMRARPVRSTRALPDEIHTRAA